MPKYRHRFLRMSFEEAFIEVEADNEAEAQKVAQIKFRSIYPTGTSWRLLRRTIKGAEITEINDA